MEKLKRYIIFIIGLGQPDHQGDAGDIAHFVDPVRAESQLPVQLGAVYHFFQPFSHRAATDHFRQKL